MRLVFGIVWTAGTLQRTSQCCTNTLSPAMLTILDMSAIFAPSFAPHETLSEITNHSNIETNPPKFCQIHLSHNCCLYKRKWIKITGRHCSNQAIVLLKNIKKNKAIIKISCSTIVGPKCYHQETSGARWSCTRPWSCPRSWPLARERALAAWSASTPAPWRATSDTTWSPDTSTSATLVRCVTKCRNHIKPGSLISKHIRPELPRSSLL